MMRKMPRRFFDSHVHSYYSNDSEQTISEICRMALDRGLQGIAITDHANMSIMEEDRTFENIAASALEAKQADKLCGGKLRVFCGVEISESSDNQDNTQKLLRSANFDVVVGSVHKVRFKAWKDFYSKICFDKTFSQENLYGFMGAYFEELLCMAEREDYDVLAHLTCPLRYINGKYHRGIQLELYEDVIDKVLNCLIRRNKALEINTSGIHGIYNSLMPDEGILKRYYAMGGRLLTLASDAHTPERIGNAFPEAASLLEKIGFPGYYFYECRQAHFVPWNNT